MPTKLTTEILTAAIDGFEMQKTRIDALIAEIRQMLDGGSKSTATSESPSRKRRKIPILPDNASQHGSDRPNALR